MRSLILAEPDSCALSFWQSLTVPFLVKSLYSRQSCITRVNSAFPCAKLAQQLRCAALEQTRRDWCTGVPPPETE
jgi:hypothetical protein